MNRRSRHNSSRSSTRGRVLALLGTAFLCFFVPQVLMWWRFDADTSFSSSSSPLFFLFAPPPPPLPPLLPPSSTHPCYAQEMELWDARQAQIDFCASSVEGGSPDYLRPIPLRCPLSALGGKEEDRNVTLYGYATHDKVRWDGWMVCGCCLVLAGSSCSPFDPPTYPQVSDDVERYGYWEKESMYLLLLLMERARLTRPEWREEGRGGRGRPPEREELTFIDVGGNLGKDGWVGGWVDEHDDSD